MQAQAAEALERFSASTKLTFTTGLKKTAQTQKNNYRVLELDELYWFVGKKAKTETRENTYVMTMVSRLPRQIVGYDVALDKSSQRIQKIVDNGPEAEYYCTDGYLGYVDIVYPGKHIRNVRNKSDTFTVKGINADLDIIYQFYGGEVAASHERLKRLRLYLNFSCKLIMLSV